MKRLIILIIISVILGVFSWIIYIRLSRGNFMIDPGSLPSVTEMYTLTPFLPRTDTPTPTASPTVTSTPVHSPTPTASLTLTPSSTTTLSPTPTPTITPTPLREAFIKGIKGRWPAFSLDCESRSAVDWAAFFGYPIDEIEFFNALPASDDPDFGFVGDVHAPWGQTPPYGYGVHAEPVAKLLRSYGVSAEARYNMTFEALKAELSAGRPVIVWVVGRVGRGTPVVYTSLEGREITVARFEHTVILIGYTPLDVTVLDGYWVYSRQIGDFLHSWGVLGNMAVIMGQ